MASQPASFEDDAVSPRVARLGCWLAPLLFAVCLLLPTPEGLSTSGQRLAAMGTLMAVLWVTQSVPMEVTSLLPLALFPILGIQSSKAVSSSYFSDSSFLYLGGFILALGLERWGLHRRLALGIIVLTGTGVRRIVLGFMLATFTISMWISNTAAALMMLPIALSLLSSLEALHTEPRDVEIARDGNYRRFAMALMLGIGYAATLGGMATLVGTPTNVVYVEVFLKQFPDGPPLSAGQWIATWTPCALAFLIVTWLLVTARLDNLEWMTSWDRNFFRAQQRELGPWTPGQMAMMVVFSVTALLWLTRTGFDVGASWRLPGWDLAAVGWLKSLSVADANINWINDSTVAMAMALMMFVIPIRTPQHHWQPLMDWSTASRLPWGILLLFGGGFAIADAARATGLAEWSGVWLAQAAGHLPPWALIAVVCLLVTFLSEFTSNVATANALLPIIAGLAVALNLDPRLLMLPATLAASCGFMLPIGTPPNAIVFGTGRIRITDMVFYGFLLDLVGVALIVLATYTLLIPTLQIDPRQAPAWAIPADSRGTP